MTKKLISWMLCFFFIFEQSAYAQMPVQLTVSNYLSSSRSTIIQEKFRPLHLRFLSYDLQANTFRLLLDKGDDKELTDTVLTDTSKTLLKYFLVGVALPNDSFWVNLRPDSPASIIDPLLAKTDIGRIMLECDLQLKKDTAQATSPQTIEGKEYWSRLYRKAGELFGRENVTIPTLTRPWIVPDEVIVRETGDSAYIYKATLKVMLEQDYLKDSSTYSFTDPRLKQLNEYSSQLVRELVIPKLNKEINSAKRYAALRQVYYSLIMAQWFKARFAGKNGEYAALINTKNLANLGCNEPYAKETYFKEYKKSFEKGEYNLQEPASTPFGQVVRSYFSGGMRLMVPEVNQAIAGSVAGDKVFAAASRNPAAGDTLQPMFVDAAGNHVVGHGQDTAVSNSDMDRKNKALAILGIQESDARWADLWGKIELAHKVGLERGHGLGLLKPDGTREKSTFDYIDISRKAYILRGALAAAGFAKDDIPGLVRQLMKQEVAGQETQMPRGGIEVAATPMTVYYDREPITVVLGYKGSLHQWVTLRIFRYEDIPEDHPLKTGKNPENMVLTQGIGYFIISDDNPYEYKGMRDAEVWETGRNNPGRFTYSMDVSRQHLRIERKGDKFIFTDLGSTNGTAVIPKTPAPGAGPQQVDRVVFTNEEWEREERPDRYQNTRYILQEAFEAHVSYKIIDPAIWDEWLGLVKQIRTEGGVLRQSEADRIAQLSRMINVILRNAIDNAQNNGVITPREWAEGMRPPGFVDTQDLIANARSLGLNVRAVVGQDYDAMWALLDKIADEQQPLTGPEVEKLVALTQSVAQELRQAIDKELARQRFEEEVVFTAEAWLQGKRPEGYVEIHRLIQQAENADLDLFEVIGTLEYKELSDFWRSITVEGRPLTRKDVKRLAELSQVAAERLARALRKDQRDTAFAAEQPVDPEVKAKKLNRKVSMACHPDLFATQYKSAAEEYFKELQKINNTDGLSDADKSQKLKALLESIKEWGAPKLSDKKGKNGNGGHMKSLGTRNQFNADAALDLPGQYEKFEALAAAVAPQDVYGVQARVIAADIGDFGAHNYYSPAYGLVIVVNAQMSGEIQEEGKFHEAREVYWMGRDFTQQEAHVIASAEQSQRSQFLDERGLTRYHEESLQRLRAQGRLQEIIDEYENKAEARQFHRDTVQAANEQDSGAAINEPGLELYEEKLYQRAKELAADNAQASSAAAAVPESSKSAVGGIDFRAIPIITQAMTNLHAGVDPAAIAALRTMQLGREWEYIQRLVNSGIHPSTNRIKEYVQAACLQGTLDNDADKVLGCISSILRDEEGECALTDPGLRDILVVLQSGMPEADLRSALTGIN